jgi:hypothetical protein
LWPHVQAYFKVKANSKLKYAWTPPLHRSQTNFPQMTQIETELDEPQNAYVWMLDGPRAKCAPHYAHTLSNILGFLGYVGFGRHGVQLEGECTHYHRFDLGQVDLRMTTRRLLDLRAIGAEIFRFMRAMMRDGVFCVHTDCMDFVEMSGDYMLEDVKKFCHRRGTRADLYGALHTALCVLLRYGARSDYEAMDAMEDLYDRLQECMSVSEQRAIYGPVDDPQDPCYGQEYEGVLHEHKFLYELGVPDWETLWQTC